MLCACLVFAGQDPVLCRDMRRSAAMGFHRGLSRFRPVAHSRGRNTHRLTIRYVASSRAVVAMSSRQGAPSSASRLVFGAMARHRLELRKRASERHAATAERYVLVALILEGGGERRVSGRARPRKPVLRKRGVDGWVDPVLEPGAAPWFLLQPAVSRRPVLPRAGRLERGH